MDNQVIPFPVDRKAVGPVVSLFALQYIKELAKTQRTAMVIYEGEPPALPYVSNGWSLESVPDISTLPMEIQRRVYVGVNMGVPIKGILIAHELPKQPKRIERREAPERVATRRHRGNHLFQTLRVLVLTTVALVATLGALALLPVIVKALGVVATMVLIFGAIFVGSGGDPVVVALVDDVDSDGNDVLSWVCLGAWYE